MATNPNPSRITAASWWFMEQLLLDAPGSTNGGTYTDKPGYHGTRAQNVARDGGYTDYSVRAPADREGPSDKTAGYDWVFPEAQNGDYRRMAVYGARLRTAYLARDPRLDGWREALGQTDLDTPPEGLDFQGHYERQPDGTHSWHWHFSEVRQHVESYDNKRAMLSVLRGETLAQYEQGEDMLTPEEIVNAVVNGSTNAGYVPNDPKRSPIYPAATFSLRALHAKVDASSAREVAMAKTIEALVAALTAGGGSVETAPIIAAIREVGVDVEQLHAQLAEATERAVAAERRENQLLAQAHTAAATTES